jgi:hypothetical protein
MKRGRSLLVDDVAGPTRSVREVWLPPEGIRTPRPPVETLVNCLRKLSPAGEAKKAQRSMDLPVLFTNKEAKFLVRFTNRAFTADFFQLSNPCTLTERPRR